MGKNKEKGMMDNHQKDVLKVFLELHRAVGAHLEINDICQILVDKIVYITNCSGCAIMLIENSIVRVISEKGFKKSLGNIEFTIEMPVIKQIIQTKQSIITGDVQNNPQVSACLPYGCSISSLICVPIIIQEEVKGLFIWILLKRMLSLKMMLILFNYYLMKFQ